MGSGTVVPSHSKPRFENQTKYNHAESCEKQAYH